jgi:hypothetical protein
MWEDCMRSVLRARADRSSGAAWDRRDERAFGLIEGLFAAIVLAIGSLGVASAIVQGAALADVSRDELRAWDAVRFLRGRIQAHDFSEMALAYHKKGFDVTGLPAVDGDTDGLPGSIVFEPVAGHYKTYEVTIAVNWQRSKRMRAVSTAFFVSNIYNDRDSVPPLDEVKEGTAPTLGLISTETVK